MKIIDGSVSLILVGKWNRHILTPKWVARKIFEEEKIQVEFPINNPEIGPRYRSESNIIFKPSVHRCEFFPLEPYEDETLRRTSLLVKRLVSILVHTPITGMGINFGFEEKSEDFIKLGLFGIDDTDDLLELGLKSEETEIIRHISIENRTLNLKAIFNPNTVTLDFNFHYNATSANDVAGIINDGLIISNRDLALTILEKVYELTLDEMEAEL